MRTTCHARMLVLGVLACTAATHALAGTAQGQHAQWSALDQYVERAMSEWGVPGLAIAVVKDDSVVLLRGYGVLEQGRSEAVGENTVFGIGSVTKAFTSTALALLVAERKLEWDAPVIRYLPSFRLADPYATHNATVRDLLLNRSGAPGLEAGETSLWYGKAATTEELLRLAAQKPGWSFRSRFDYSNLMYVAAGQLIPALTGSSYEDFVRARLFEPLGMRRSDTKGAGLRDDPDVAAAHARSGDTTRVIPGWNIDHLAPAGSIHSSAADMARWLRFQLAYGRVEGTRLLDSVRVAEMHEPAVVIRRTPLWAQIFPGADVLTWGMGWTVSVYRGERVVEHTGIGGGMHALLGLMPSRQLGVAILSNLDFPENQLPEALRYAIYDHYLGGAFRDWSAELLRARSAAPERTR